MPYTVGNGYTTAEIKIEALSGPTVLSGAAAWGFGSWTTVVPANTITVDFTLLAVTCFIDPLAPIDVRHEGLLEIGIGAFGSEVTIIQVPFSYFIDTAAGHCMEQVIEIYPRKIPANSRVALRIADDVASALTYGGCRIQYVEALDTYTTDPIKSYPTTSAGVQPVSSATAWTWGSWVELVPANTITSDFDISDISFLFPPVGLTKDVRYQGVIQLGVGAAGSETPIISLPITFFSDTLVDHVPDNQVVFLPVPRRVAGNSRVAVRVANDGALALTYGPIKIRYIKPPVTISIDLNEPALSFSDSVAREAQRPLSESTISILAETLARAVQRQLSEASISIPAETLARQIARALSEPSIAFSDEVVKTVQRNRFLDEAAVSIAAETIAREIRRTLSEAAMAVPAETLTRFISRALSEPSIFIPQEVLARYISRILSEPSQAFSDSLIRTVSVSLSEPSILFADSIVIEKISGAIPAPVEFFGVVERKYAKQVSIQIYASKLLTLLRELDLEAPLLVEAKEAQGLSIPFILSARKLLAQTYQIERTFEKSIDLEALRFRADFISQSLKIPFKTEASATLTLTKPRAVGKFRSLECWVERSSRESTALTLRGGRRISKRIQIMISAERCDLSLKSLQDLLLRFLLADSSSEEYEDNEKN